MKVQYVRPRTLCLRGLAFAFALGGFQVAHAAGGFSKAEATGSAKISWDSGLITQNAGWTPSTVTNNTSGPPSIKGTSTGTIGGKPLVIDVDAKVIPSSAKAGMLKAMKLAPVVGNIINAVELVQWAKDTIGSNSLVVYPDGSAYETKDSLSCPSGSTPEGSGCYKYSYSTSFSPSFSSGSEACTAFVTSSGLTQPSYSSGICSFKNVANVTSTQTIYRGNFGSPATTTTAKLLTEQELADKIAVASGWPSSTSLALQKALTYPDVQVETEAPTISGPSTVTGTPVTSSEVTTNPDGSTNTTNKTVTPTYNITYQGDSYTYTTTNVTTSTTTNSTTNQSTTTTKTETVEDPCKVSPDSIGCSKFGTPDTQTVTKNTTAISITPFSLSSGGGCPSPLPVSVFGHSYELSYTPACTAASYLRFLILAMAAVMAGYVFVEGLKS